MSREAERRKALVVVYRFSEGREHTNRRRKVGPLLPAFDNARRRGLFIYIYDPETVRDKYSTRNGEVVTARYH